MFIRVILWKKAIKLSIITKLAEKILILPKLKIERSLV